MSDPCRSPIDLSSEESSSPLGLSLRKSPSLLDLIQMRLSQDIPPPSEAIKGHNLEPPNYGNDGKGCTFLTEKLKASNFPAKTVKIGRWKRDAENDGDLVAKVYFVKKKLVWEVRENELKRKIEMQWIDISAIKATYGDELETLEIELSQPPMFYREVNPQPRKPTTWQATSDFTYRQATFYRMHYLEFPAGYLQKNYEKLLSCDPRLQRMSQKNFPSHPTYFINMLQETHDLPPKFNVQRSRFSPIYNQPSGNCCTSQFYGIGKPQALSTPNQPIGDFGPHDQPIGTFNAMPDPEPNRGAVTVDSFNSGIDYTTIKEHAIGVVDPRNWYFGNINMSLADGNAGMKAVFNDSNPVFDNNIETTSLYGIVQEQKRGYVTIDSFNSGIDYTTIKEHDIGVVDPRNWNFGNINMSLADGNAGMKAVFNDSNPVFDNNIETTSLYGIVQEQKRGYVTIDSFNSGIDYTTIKEHDIGVVDPRNWNFGNINMSLADGNAGMKAVFNDSNPVLSDNNIETTSLYGIVQNLDNQTELQRNAFSSPAANFNPRRVPAGHCTAGLESFDQNKIESLAEYMLSDSHSTPYFDEDQIMASEQSYISLINEPENLGSQLQIWAFNSAHCNHIDRP